MTCRERLKLEHPSDVDSDFCGGCFSCPDSDGREYLSSPEWCGKSSKNFNPNHPLSNASDDSRCAACWDREIPEEKEKENKPMKKTKTMLEEELEQKRTEIEDLKKELENEIKRSEKYKQFEECADDLKALRDSFINSGFSDKQAFMMVLQIIGASH